jgi:hypothetical protein
MQPLLSWGRSTHSSRQENSKTTNTGNDAISLTHSPIDVEIGEGSRLFSCSTEPRLLSFFSQLGMMMAQAIKVALNKKEYEKELDIRPREEKNVEMESSRSCCIIRLR